jgi:hypothetical protein
MCDSKSLFITSRKVAGIELFGDISTGAFRPLVPPAFRDSAAASLHGVAHPGVEATVKLVTSKFCWPGIRKFVRRYTVSELPEIKGVKTRPSLAGNHRRSSTPFRARTCGLGGPASAVFRVFLPLHNSGPDHTLARSYTPQ